MLGRTALVLLVVCLSVAQLHAQPEGRRVALVVGNNSYEKLSPLSNPVGDATRIAGILAGNGFEVLSCDGEKPGCFNLDRGGLLDALDELEDQAEGAEVALVFYAGHGMQTQSGNVLAPTDIEISCGEWKAKREVLLDDVLEAMAGAREKIVILDACRNDPFQAQQCVQRGGRSLSFGSIAVPDSASRFLLMTSTQNGQLAQDGTPGTHSPFAEALFHWMESEPARHFDQMLDLVTKRVIEATTAVNFTQVPEILIRGGAPEACLAPSKCVTDPQAAALRAEVERLRSENARSQELAEIGAAYLRSTGVDAEAMTEEDRQRILTGIAGAGKALVDSDDDRAEQALQSLRDGDEEAAERLFAEVLDRRKREAAEVAARAEQERKDAADAARHIAALAWPKNIAKAAFYYREAADLDPDTLENWERFADASFQTGRLEDAWYGYQRTRDVAERTGDRGKAFWALQRLTDIARNEGRFREAAELAEESRVLAAAVVAMESDNDQFRFNLAAAELKIGDLRQSENDFDAAMAAFRAYIVINEEFALKYPDLPDLKREQAIGHARVSGVYMAKRLYASALEAQTRAVDLLQGLADADPSNVNHRIDLASNLERLGSGQSMLSRYDEAETTFRSAHDLIKELADADPTNARLQQDLGFKLRRLAGLAQQRGKPEDADRYFDQAIVIHERLVAENPANVEWKESLANAYLEVGEARQNRDDLDGAMALFQKAFNLRDALVTGNPDREQLVRELTVVTERIAGVHAQRKDFQAALREFQANYDRMEPLLAAKPDNQDFQRFQSVTLNRIAESKRDLGDLEGADDAFAGALAVRETILARNPDSRFALDDVWWNLDTMRALHADTTGDLAKALDYAERLVPVIDRIAALPGAGSVEISNTAYFRQTRGKARMAAGDGDGALADFREVLRKRTEIALAEPGDVTARRNVASAQIDLGDLLLDRSAAGEALQAFLENKRIHEELLEDEPGNADYRLNVMVIENRIGRALMALGDPAGGLERFKAALAIAEERERQGMPLPGVDITYALDMIMEAHRARGELDQAGQAALRAMQVREAMAAATDALPVRHTDLLYSYGKVVQIALARADGALALETSDKEIALRRADAEKNARYRVDLAYALSQHGNAYLAVGRPEDGRAAFAESQRLYEELAAAEPMTDYRLYVAYSAEMTGFSLRRMGALDSAEAPYLTAVALRRALAAAAPDDAARHREAGIVVMALADLHALRGRRADAIPLYEQEIAVRQRFAGSLPAETAWQYDLALAKGRLGDTLAEAGRTDQAIAVFDDHRRIIEPLASSDPNNSQWQREQASSYAGYGKAHRIAGDIGPAEENLKRGRQMIADLSQRFPDGADWAADLDWFDRELGRIASLRGSAGPSQQ